MWLYHLFLSNEFIVILKYVYDAEDTKFYKQNQKKLGQRFPYSKASEFQIKLMGLEHAESGELVKSKSSCYGNAENRRILGTTNLFFKIDRP